MLSFFLFFIFFCTLTFFLQIGKCATNQVYYLQTAIFKQVDLASAFYTPPERKSAHEKQIAAFERLTIKETDPIWYVETELCFSTKKKKQYYFGF